MRCLFASDLHLSSENPDKTALFRRVLARAATTGTALYLLGDIFEIWLGDDDDSAPHPAVVAALRDYSAGGGDLFVMSGNRDFLLGGKFSRETGATLLGDWHRLDLLGAGTLLTHGDLLCTRDVQYQAFRQYVRDPANQQAFLANSLDQRRVIAANTRSGTKASMLEKEDVIMDVEQSTVARMMREFDVSRLIHGHTHRPGRHAFTGDDGVERERHVLGDWYGDECLVLYADDNGLRSLPAAAFVDGSGC